MTFFLIKLMVGVAELSPRVEKYKKQAKCDELLQLIWLYN